MKILHTVEFYHPSVGGAQEVVRQLSERLAEKGHDVTVATSRLSKRKEFRVNGVRIVEFSVRGNLAHGLQGEVASYRDFVQNSNFDIIMNYAAQQWTTDALLPVLSAIRAVKVLVPCGFSGLFAKVYSSYFESMKAWLTQYDRVVLLSENYRDSQFVKSISGVKQTLIPNGAGSEEFDAAAGNDIRKILKIPSDAFLVLHVGSHTGHKGHAEAIRMFRKAKLKNAILMIVGNDFGAGCGRSCKVKAKLFNLWPGHKADGKKVIIAELDRMSTVAVYKSADLFLFPSNIECSPLVLFEAMASKTCFLASSAGNSEEIIEWSGGGQLITTRVDRFGACKVDLLDGVRKIEALWNDPSARVRLGEAGYAAWKKNYTWGAIANQYEALYRTLMDKS